MKIKFNILLLLSFLLISPLVIKASSLLAPAKIIISYNKQSIYRFSYLKINGSFLGRMYRGSKKTFYFKPNEPLKISLYRKEARIVKNIETEAGKTYNIKLKLLKNSEKDISLHNLIISLKNSSEYNYGYISIDKKHYGFIRKNRKREFFFAPGKHIIAVYRFGIKETKEITLQPEGRTNLYFTLKNND